MTEKEVREVLTGYFMGISGNVADEESVQFSMFAKQWVADHPPKPTREQIESLAIMACGFGYTAHETGKYPGNVAEECMEKFRSEIDAICGGNDERMDERLQSGNSGSDRDDSVRGGNLPTGSESIAPSDYGTEKLTALLQRLDKLPTESIAPTETDWNRVPVGTDVTTDRGIWGHFISVEGDEIRLRLAKGVGTVKKETCRIIDPAAEIRRLQDDV